VPRRLARLRMPDSVRVGAVRSSMRAFHGAGRESTEPISVVWTLV